MTQNFPQHLAFIIDGNGRWARKRGLPRMVGHKFGFENLKSRIQDVFDLGIKYLTIYAFSCENWKRPKDEVDGLKNLFLKFLSEDNKEFANNGCHIKIFGQIDDFGDEIATKAKEIEKETKNNDKFFLNLCLSYGGRQEILRAVNNIIKDDIKSVDEQTFNRYLYSADMPDVDYVIRTSGEMRTSNFMPYQTTYSEWYFPKTLWPDFKTRHLIKALKIFNKRDRRYGGIK